jgi:ribosomal protein S6
MAKKVIESVQEDRDAKLYEFAFHLVPKMSVEDAVSAFTGIKNQITATGATIKNESAPALLNLAYQMDITVESVRSKYNQAYFAWVIFEATGSQINELKEEIKHRTDVIRHLLITTKNESPLQAADVALVLNADESYAQAEDAVEAPEVVEETAPEVAETEAAEDSENDQKVDEAIDKLVE